MKKLLLLILGGVWALGAHAQQYATTTHTLTNTVAAFTTNAAVSGAQILAFTATKYQDVNVTIKTELTAAGTTVSDFKFVRSVDGANFETTPSIVMSIANAGTTSVIVSSNINLGAAGFLKLKTITNGDDDGVETNIVVKYTVKPARFGR